MDWSCKLVEFFDKRVFFTYPMLKWAPVIYCLKSSLVFSSTSYLLIPKAAFHTLLSVLTCYFLSRLKILSKRFLKGSSNTLNPFFCTALILCLAFWYSDATPFFRSSTLRIDVTRDLAEERYYFILPKFGNFSEATFFDLFIIPLRV